MSHYTESFNRLVMNTRTIVSIHNTSEYSLFFFISSQLNLIWFIMYRAGL